MRTASEQETLAYFWVGELKPIPCVITISGGPHQLVEHGAHLVMRRHGALATTLRHQQINARLL